MTSSNQVTIDDVLIDGDEVAIGFKVGEYFDGYPILSSVITIYCKKDKSYNVKDCADADWLIGESFYKMGMLCNRFMTALVRKNKIQSVKFINFLDFMVVKRNNKYINIRKLMKELRYKTQSTTSE